VGGAAHVLADLKVQAPPPLTLREVGVAMQAAYAKGYREALSEAEPLPHEEACKRAEILLLVIPVE
jgi:hypothetical protein